MRLMAAALSRATAWQTARYVLPVPAGPMGKTLWLFRTASRYFFCPSVFALMGFPRAVVQMTSEKRGARSPAPFSAIMSMA
jgi:hypothetical protein